MGKISKALRNSASGLYNSGKQKANEIKADRERRAKLNKELDLKKRDAYNAGLQKASVARAYQEGRQAGWKPQSSGFEKLGNFGESFSKAGEDMFGFGTIPKGMGQADNGYYADMMRLPGQGSGQHRRRKHHRGRH